MHKTAVIEALAIGKTQKRTLTPIHAKSVARPLRASASNHPPCAEDSEYKLDSAELFTYAAVGVLEGGCTTKRTTKETKGAQVTRLPRCRLEWPRERTRRIVHKLYCWLRTVTEETYSWQSYFLWKDKWEDLPALLSLTCNENAEYAQREHFTVLPPPRRACALCRRLRAKETKQLSKAFCSVGYQWSKTGPHSAWEKLLPRALLQYCNWNFTFHGQPGPSLVDVPRQNFALRRH